jgi:rare lipoprotein A
MQAISAFLIIGTLTIGLGTASRAASLPTGDVTAAAAQPPMLKSAVLDSGEATWYGPRHAGRRTYSGERFDPRKMTAAHPTLPIGTMVRVTDMATGRSVIVRVNDREPPHGVRCIDLSEGAALALGIHGRGVAEVTLTAAEQQAAPVEVAEAPEDGADAAAPHNGSARAAGRRLPSQHVTSRHGRPHRRHGAR